MYSKKIVLKTFILFLVFISLVILSLHFYKQRTISVVLERNSQIIKKSFNNAYNSAQNIVDLIMFEALIYDKNIISFYENYHKNPKNIKNEFFEYLKTKYYYFKSSGIKGINFYLDDNSLLLSLQDKNKSAFNYKKRSLAYVNRTLKNYDGIQIDESDASISFIRPILDENLKLLGSVEVEFSLEFLLSIMQSNLDYQMFLLYKKEQIDKRVFKKNLKSLREFDLNENYYLKMDISKVYQYDRDFFNDLFLYKDDIKNKMDSKSKISFAFDSTKAVYFLPIKQSINNATNLYVVAYTKNSRCLDELNSEVWFLFFIVLFFSLFITFFAIYILVFKNSYFHLEKEYDSLLQSIDKYVIMAHTDKEGFITKVTKAFCNTSGYSKSELIGRNMNIIRHPDMSKLFFKKMWKSLLKGKPWEGEIKNLDKYGNSYWIKGSIFPKFNDDNEIIGFISIRVNITNTKELKKINSLLKEDLSNKLNEIKMKDRSLLDNTKVELMSKVLDSSANQWKTPIANISIALANLNANVNSSYSKVENYKKVYDDISCNLKILSVNLNEFKSLFTKNRIDDKYNVFKVLYEAKLIYKEECKLNNIDISLDSNKDIYCYGVYEELKHVMMNLIKHSIYQLKISNLKHKLIELSVINDEDEVIIKIEDNAKSEAKKIIDEILSEDECEEQMNKDTGLSLYIAKLLIRKIGATLTYENNEKNTVFYIKLVSHDRRKNIR